MLNAIQIHVFCFNIASENYAPHKCILKDFMSKGREHSFAKASSYFSVDKTSINYFTTIEACRCR
jgi:hypothetical protein